MNREAIASAVRRARMEHGWTVAKAARQADIDRVTWARIEQGLGVHDVNLYSAARLLELDYEQLTSTDTRDDQQAAESG